MSSYVLVLLLVLYSMITINANLETVQDDELLNLIRSEKYVVSLFSRRYCEECDKLENELTGLREDLVETLNAWVVKVVDSQLTRLYSPTKEPALVFFRHGVPLLYDGPVEDEAILHMFTVNKEPIVKELNDDNFEHLTQVATGATTGDWFVMFYSPDCIDCQRLQARWEAVGAKIKSRTNLARVNRASEGAATARRFDVYHVPTFILFKKGKMYRYQIQKYDVASFVSFAQDWYKNMKGERVPVPKSPFDDLISFIAMYLRENPWIWQVGFGMFLLGIGLGLLHKRFQAGRKQESAKKEKKVKKEAKDK